MKTVDVRFTDPPVTRKDWKDRPQEVREVLDGMEGYRTSAGTTQDRGVYEHLARLAASLRGVFLARGK